MNIQLKLQFKKMYFCQQESIRNTSSNVIAVCAQWFWDCIRNQTLLPIEDYQ